MKRRSFLALLGLAPVAPIAAKAAETEEIAPRRMVSEGIHAVRDANGYICDLTSYVEFDDGTTLYGLEAEMYMSGITRSDMTIHSITPLARTREG